MFDGRTLHSREAIEILEENFGDLEYRTRIRKTVRYAEAPVQGQLRPQVRPDGLGRGGLYRELAREIVAAKEARMARKRASMREGPLAELFRATEAAQRAQGEQPAAERPPWASRSRRRIRRERPSEPRHSSRSSRAACRPSRERDDDVELDATVEHVYDFEVGRAEREAPVARAAEPSVTEPRAASPSPTIPRP